MDKSNHQRTPKSKNAALEKRGGNGNATKDAPLDLQSLVAQASAVVSKQWSYNTNDWVLSVAAADIDNDGDIEVLVASRDSSVYALTRWGSLKWKTNLKNGQWITTLAVVPYLASDSKQVSVVAATDRGQVYGLDHEGTLIPNWETNTSSESIQQIHVPTRRANFIIVGSEDHYTYILDSETGEEIVHSPFINGAINAVASYAPNDSSELWILAGSADGYVYILDDQAQIRTQFLVENSVYALAVAQWGEAHQPYVLVSTNNKDLFCWKLTSGEDGELSVSQEWKLSAKSSPAPFASRLQEICVADINNDGKLEILLGSEDKHLYILNTEGQVLWKHFIGSTVYSIAAVDINFDEQTEIIVGLEDNSVQVLCIDLQSSLYQKILEAGEKQKRSSLNKIMTSLSVPEQTLLRDFIKEEKNQQEQMELYAVPQHKARREYKQALTILTRLRLRQVQYYWRHEKTDMGHIKSFCLGDLALDEKDEIIVWNYKGQLFALDIEREQHIWFNPSSEKNRNNKNLWSAPPDTRIQMLHTGKFSVDDEYDRSVLCSGDQSLYIINRNGELEKQQRLVDDEERILSLHLLKQEIIVGDESKEIVKEILIGTDCRIGIYDPSLNKLDEILTSAAITFVNTCDITAPESKDIISVNSQHKIQVYNREKKTLWDYQLNERIRTICQADIDEDGKSEILVGSEDRYVYVLDYEGRLKWRYLTPHRVLAIDTIDFDKDGKREILLGVGDGYLYVLNYAGDLLWKFYAGDRIQAVSAKDMNDDQDFVEIAIATDDKLFMLQIIDSKKVRDEISECASEYLKNIPLYFDQPERALVELTKDPNEYVRSFAFIRLSGMKSVWRDQELAKELLSRALRDRSPEVRRSIALALVNLGKTIATDNAFQIRRLLSQLANTPEQEIRLALIDQLRHLTRVDASLCFEYLERFSHNVDVMVRRAVVRNLYHLAKAHPKQVFRLLRENMHDEHLWIRQEVGRSLAHYFDLHTDLLIENIHELFTNGIDPEIVRQMAFSASKPIVRTLFSVLTELLITSSENEAILSVLDRTVEALQETCDLKYGQETLKIYTDLNQLLRIHTIDEITQYPWSEEIDYSVRRFQPLTEIFQGMKNITEQLLRYRRSEALGDRAARLLQVITDIEDLRSRFNRPVRGAFDARMPEDGLFLSILQRWYDIIMEQLRRLRGDAELSFELPGQTFTAGEEVSVVLLIKNTGRSPADNVFVTLKPSEEGDFELLGEETFEIDTVSTSKSEKASFDIRPHVDTPHLKFEIIYDDAERHEKKTPFADELRPKGDPSSTFREIPNRYNSGNPIRDEEGGMFFGREEDLRFLKDRLTVTDINSVVLLTGQRRSGKTSLLYQLLHDLKPHCPVLIDLQSLSLTSTIPELLYGITKIIADTLRQRRITVPQTSLESFQADSTRTFEDFLSRVTKNLAGNRLILLFDEFETLEQKVRQGQLNEDFLRYLRSRMQHQEGINFLLSGAPRIRYLTKGYWSIFFQIARSHTIGRLKNEEAHALIVKPVDDALSYDDLAVERICELTGNQPYLIHFLCENLIRECNRQKKRYVTISDVNRIVYTVLESGDNQFGWIWQQSSSIEKFLLSLLAQEHGAEGRISLDDIKRGHSHYALPYDQKVVSEALENLIQESFVESNTERIWYRIPTGLLRDWLRKNWPPEKVVRTNNLLEASSV